MSEGLNLALIKIGNKLDIDGKGKHRYQSRSRSLERDTGHKIYRTKEGFKLVFGLGFDSTNAARKYGKRIHEGFGTWKADQFVYQAAKRNRKFISKTINDEVAKVTKRF